MTDPAPGRDHLRSVLATIVVVAGVGAIIASLAITLNYFHSGTNATANAVAVLTPTLAGIAGVVGLYFGLAGNAAVKTLHAQSAAEQAKANKKLSEVLEQKL